MPTEVETSGGRLSGTDAGGVRVFRGVRYAQPLEGARRFLPPQPVVPQAGLVDATEVGPPPHSTRCRTSAGSALPGWRTATTVSP